MSSEREWLRTVVLAAIDAVSDCLRDAYRCTEAIDTALVAVVADPLGQLAGGADRGAPRRGQPV